MGHFLCTIQWPVSVVYLRYSYLWHHQPTMALPPRTTTWTQSRLAWTEQDTTITRIWQHVQSIMHITVMAPPTIPKLSLITQRGQGRCFIRGMNSSIDLFRKKKKKKKIAQPPTPRPTKGAVCKAPRM